MRSAEIEEVSSKEEGGARDAEKTGRELARRQSRGRIEETKQTDGERDHYEKERSSRKEEDRERRGVC